MKVRQALSAAIDEFSNSGLENPRVEAEWLIRALLNVGRIDLYNDENLSLDISQSNLLQDWIKRRQQGEPLQYILGTVEFRHLTLKVDHRALIPRPETEGLVDLALKFLHDQIDPRVLDLGTGSGNIALSIAAENPQAQLTAVDISHEALELAAENGHRLGLNNRIRWIQADAFQTDIINLLKQKFDLVVSNPPYVSQREYWELPGEIRLHEPKAALLAEDDGLKAFKRLAEIAGQLLKTGNHIICEIGARQSGPTLRLFQNTGWDAYLRKDLSGKPRYLVASKHRTSQTAIWWKK